MRRQRKAKILATLGPASSSRAEIEALFLAGADVFRLNFSHGSHEDHAARYETIRAVEADTKRPIGVLMDREPPGFFAVTPVSFPVVRAPSREFGRIYKVERVPLTVRIAPGGKVQGIAHGPLDAITLGELFRP